MPSTTMTLTLQIAGAELELQADIAYDYQPAQRAIFYSPGHAVGPTCDAEAHLVSIAVRGVNILPLLDEDTVAAIEADLVETVEPDDEADEADRAYDDYRDRDTDRSWVAS